MHWADLVISLPAAIMVAFVFALGACVGSFVNVVAWRMPQGQSVVSPPSRCPTCGFRLRWRHNLPVLGYLFLRGRCAACGVGIPARYLLSEIAVGLLFAGAYAVLYLPVPGGYWHSVGDGWWREHGVRSVPGLVVLFWGLGSLSAMTLSDLRTCLIPVAIPTWMSAVAFLGWPVAALVAGDGHAPFPLATPPWPACMAAAGAMGGLFIGRVLLWSGVLPRSFADYEQYLAAPDDVFADYPHARREMMKEAAFLGPAVLLGGLGWLCSGHLAPPEAMPGWLGALFAVATGFIVGGAIVWVLRLVASLLLDTEAMGMGDVHLMAAGGATFGWPVAVAGFLVAPFVGLAAWIVNLVRAAPWRIPFGPSLAAGVVLAFFGHPLLRTAVGGVMAVMGVAADRARQSPGGALALAAAVAVIGAVAARLGRSGAPVAIAAAVLLHVAAVVAWILAGPASPGAGLAVAGVLVCTCVAGSVAVGARLEDGSGPRTAVARILRMLAFVVVVASVLLLVARPGAVPQP